MAQAAAAKKNYTLATGRRKTSVARIRLCEGTGVVQINGRPLDQFFTEEKDRAAVVGPLMVADMRNRLDVVAKVHGGGITGQAGAISQGVARAVKTMFNLTNAPTPVNVGDNGEAPATGEGNLGKRLHDSGYLTRDSRMKERKKYGRKGARKSFQFSKR